MNDGYQKTGNVKTYQKPLRIKEFFREKDMRSFQIHFLLKKWKKEKIKLKNAKKRKIKKIKNSKNNEISKKSKKKKKKFLKFIKLKSFSKIQCVKNLYINNFPTYLLN